METRLNNFTSEVEDFFPGIIFVSVFSFDAQNEVFYPFFTRLFSDTLEKTPLETVALDGLILLRELNDVPCSQLTALDSEHFELILLYENVAFFFLSEREKTNSFLFQSKCQAISEQILPHIGVAEAVQTAPQQQPLPEKVKSQIPTELLLRKQKGVEVHKHTQNTQSFVVHSIQKETLGPNAQSQHIHARKEKLAPFYDTIPLIESHYKWTDNALQIARPFASGVALAKMLTKLGCLNVKQSLVMFKIMVKSLQPLHDQGLAHGNLNPHNIYFESKDVFSFVDDYLFELISAEDFMRKSYAEENRIPLGHLDFLSPEQILGESAVPQSDFWSLGCLLCYFLLGEPLMSFRTPSQQVVASHYTIKQAAMERVCQKHQVLEPLLEKLLDGKPDKRFASSEELLELLNRQMEALD